jgi:uncharacterized protein
MWVSPNLERVREFTRRANQGGDEYREFLTPAMEESFSLHYRRPKPQRAARAALVHGEILSPCICLVLTNDCNLACRYCFASAGEAKGGVMAPEVARAAVDLAARNAVLTRMKTGRATLGVSFFGGGEPTVHWSHFQDIVEYARASAAAHGVGVYITVTTNGQIDEDHYAWFATHVDEVTVSMDGPAEIQNRQRCRAAGGESFRKSWSFLSHMDAAGMNISAIRATVTAESVGRMAEIAEFFWTQLGRVYPLQMEPVYFSEVGRRDCEMPRAPDFVAGLRRVEEAARARCGDRRTHGLVQTATRPLVIRPAGSYCDAMEYDGLFVTPEGFLSQCSEVSSSDDPRAKDYFVGRYDPVAGRFQVAEQHLPGVSGGLPVRCAKCFAQFSCGGGCRPRSENAAPHIRRWWCEIIRENLRLTWSDVRSRLQPAMAHIGDPQGEELIWLPIWTPKGKP